jgi:catechol 2,3-dioxygenase-like lactoylglutathione lyase family enzyme
VLIDRIDHLVLTVADVDRTMDLYARVLGMQPVTFGSGRRALRFGRHKLNLHQAGRELEPKARRPMPGSADLCLVTTAPLDRVVGHLRDQGVPVEEGPVARTGATGPITSVYSVTPTATSSRSRPTTRQQPVHGSRLRRPRDRADPRRCGRRGPPKLAADERPVGMHGLLAAVPPAEAGDEAVEVAGVLGVAGPLDHVSSRRSRLLALRAW